MCGRLGEEGGQLLKGSLLGGEEGKEGKGLERKEGRKERCVRFGNRVVCFLGGRTRREAGEYSDGHLSVLIASFLAGKGREEIRRHGYIGRPAVCCLCWSR